MEPDNESPVDSKLASVRSNGHEIQRIRSVGKKNRYAYRKGPKIPLEKLEEYRREIAAEVFREMMIDLFGLDSLPGDLSDTEMIQLLARRLRR